MKNTLRYIFLILFTAIGNLALAQHSGIVGKVQDSSGQPAKGAVIHVTLGGIHQNKATADEDGRYTIKPLNPGRYDVIITFRRHKRVYVKGVIVSTDKNTEIPLVKLKPSKLEQVEKQIKVADEPAESVETIE